MGKIKRLDPKLISQIAAGEVVERPASVAKELIENSIDAGASEIKIGVEKSGLADIRVIDDGEGMSGEDLRLAVDRHATSKITSLKNLEQLHTLGFRGEALPSIGSVSKMMLESCPDGSGEGTRLRVEGGRIFPPQWVGHPRGTTVRVSSLFYNTPARRKFLRAPGTETDRITDIVCRTALAHFDRKFQLECDGKIVLDATPAQGRAERVAQVFGAQLASRLIAVCGETGMFRVSGFASRPEFTRSSSRHQWCFINGRPVRDRGLLHAVTAAYHTLLPRGRYPFVLLFLELPPERVDFNVHPGKAEVRFADPRAVHETVRRALRSTLEAARPVVGIQPSPPVLSDPVPERSGFEAGQAPILPPAPASTSSAEHSLFEPRQESELEALVPLAQYRESYILASEKRGLVIVDQHAAHERVLYEQLLREVDRSQVKRQALLFPVTLEFPPPAARRLQEGLSELDRLGFGIEPFGGESFVVREVPALLGDRDLVSLVRDLVEDLERPPGQRGLDQVWDRLAATTACHAAVKVNFPLTTEKMRYLLEELVKTRAPMSCPHGRPILLRFPQADLERGFHRR